MPRQLLVQGFPDCAGQSIGAAQTLLKAVAGPVEFAEVQKLQLQ